jgi:hypothetical protein
MFGRCKHNWNYIRVDHLVNKHATLELGESFHVTEANRVCNVCQKKETVDLKGFWTLSELNGEI